MDPRPPFPARLFAEPGFGPFDCEALQAELNRERAANALRCVTAQIVVILAGCLVAAILGMTAWHRLTVYEAMLKHCTGV